MSMSYHLHASLMYQLTLTSRLQERRLEDGLRALGLTRLTWCILLAVHVEGHSQPADIAPFIGVDRTATSRALRQMEQRGWVARSTGRDDRRTTRVELTPAGVDLLTRAVPVAEDNAHHFLSKLTPEETEALQRIMANLRLGEAHNLQHF
ncbi:MAG: MarR family transcriptional regulator [Paracoccaceae bacterium]|nr:MarR family transcriptional regulator [Paracoccaceae bacterium]